MKKKARAGLEKRFGKAWRQMFSLIEKPIRSIPFVERKVEEQFDQVLEELETRLKPYREKSRTFTRIPATGQTREKILEEMRRIREEEDESWKKGFVSGAVYHGDPDYIRFLNEVYALNSQVNPLHADLWPSGIKYEAEIVAMTASLLGADEVGGQGKMDQGICGTVTSGGTESILLAMKTYRDWAREEKGIRFPEVLVPSTAHAAFDKAAEYFRIKLVRVPVGSDFKADVQRTARAITRNTIALVGSAPSFPHGIIDPIEELSDLASRKGIGFHTDACLGGFVLPWAARLGYPVERFDFDLPGVTSISVDTHKYGFAPKGTSVILYRNEKLRHYQYFATPDWSGGLYCSPTFAGSRPGALSAACWAALVTIGEQGYMEATRKILETAQTIREGIEQIPGLSVLGDPLWVLAFCSDEHDIYQVLDRMQRKGWNLNGLQDPPAVHLCVTLRHTENGVAQRFLADLRSSVEWVRDHPGKTEGIAPIYGMAASIPFRGIVRDLLKRYLDLLYRP